MGYTPWQQAINTWSAVVGKMRPTEAKRNYKGFIHVLADKSGYKTGQSISSSGLFFPYVSQLMSVLLLCAAQKDIGLGPLIIWIGVHEWMELTVMIEEGDFSINAVREV